MKRGKKKGLRFFFLYVSTDLICWVYTVPFTRHRRDGSISISVQVEWGWIWISSSAALLEKKNEHSTVRSNRCLLGMILTDEGAKVMGSSSLTKDGLLLAWEEA